MDAQSARTSMQDDAGLWGPLSVGAALLAGVLGLSAQVPSAATAQDASQLGDSTAQARRAGDLAAQAPVQTSSALVSSSSASSNDVLLFTAMAGAALALVGTAWEGARRHRVRVATGRTRGRRALR